LFVVLCALKAFGVGLLQKDISKELKKWMVKELVWSVTFCGSETWTLRKKDIKHIQAFDI